MKGIVIRAEAEADAAAIAAITEEAFGGNGEAHLVEALRRDGDAVLSLVAEADGSVRGHVLFSRLFVETQGGSLAAVALAPLSVQPRWQRRGIGTALVEAGHDRLRESGERLSVVLGEPAYYGRFGYDHADAAGFASAYQCDALQALAFGEAPRAGRLVYPKAFAGLG